jgi:ribonuclease T2
MEETVLRLAAIAVCLTVGIRDIAAEQERRQNEPFDFCVLALSWSPSFCEAANERSIRGGGCWQNSGKPFSCCGHGPCTRNE